MSTNNSVNVLDIGALARAIASRIWVVVVVTAIFVSLGSAYTTVRTPQYSADVLVLPPSEQDLNGLILSLIPLNRAHSPEIYDLLDFVEIFKAFKNDLASRPTQLKFLQLFGESLVQDGEIQPEYQLASADGFSRRVRGVNYFHELTSHWRLQQNNFFHSARLGIGDPVLSFTVASDRTTSRPYLRVAVTWKDPSVAAEFANRYTAFVNEQTVAKTRDLLKSGLAVRERNISDMIEYQQKLADRVRNDQLLELTEAIEIARNLELKGPTNAFGDYNIINITPPPKFYVDPSATVANPDKRSQRSLPLYHPGNLPKSENINHRMMSVPPLYTRGWHALEQERDILQKRTSLDTFIPNIRDLRGELEWVQSIKAKDTIFNAAHIEQPALTPIRPVGLNTTQIILISLLTGLLAGSFFALVGYALQLRNTQKTD